MNNISQNNHYDQLKARVLVENKVKIDSSTPVLIRGNINTSANLITENQSLINIEGSGYVLNFLDMSNIKRATLFVQNTGATGARFTLEFSPDTKLFIEDNNTTFVAPGENKIIVVSTVAKAIRLRYETEGPTSFSVYFNGQT